MCILFFVLYFPNAIIKVQWPVCICLSLLFVSRLLAKMTVLVSNGRVSEWLSFYVVCRHCHDDIRKDRRQTGVGPLEGWISKKISVGLAFSDFICIFAMYGNDVV